MTKHFGLLLLLLFCYKTCLVASSDFSNREILHLQNGNFLAHSSFDKSNWVDSVYAALTPEQRIAQLFMVATRSDIESKYDKKITNLISKYNIGGLIFMQGKTTKQAQMCNKYQSLAKTPLLIAMDAEWGLRMRLSDGMRFPYQMTLGALQNDSLIEEMGKAIAEQMRSLGVQVSFSPVADINNNPKNPVIGFRSFGENKEAVAQKAIRYMKGLQNTGVLACAKHFPGHGDTDTDSHLDLPIIQANKNRLDSLELHPFKKMIEAGVASMMTAHLYIPSLDNTKNQASTLSPKIVQNLLREELKFDGLIFTDALNMKGVAKFYEPGEVEVKALLAGNDVLLFSEDVPLAIQQIKKAIKKKKITWKEIEYHVKKILKAKKWAGLNKWKKIDLERLNKDLNQNKHQAIIEDIYENAMTLVRNNENKIPLKFNSKEKYDCFLVGGDKNNSFIKNLSFYEKVSAKKIAWEANSKDLKSLKEKLLNAKNPIVTIHLPNPYAHKNFGVKMPIVEFLKDVNYRNPLTIVVFGNPYALKYFDFASTLICAYQDEKLAQQAAAAALVGAIAFKGKLPVSVKNEMKYGLGIETKTKNILKFALPESVGFPSEKIEKIDSIAQKAVLEEATPGCQILAIVGNEIIYNKNFGHFTYDKKSKITDKSLYDIASVTKIAASALSLMKLYEEGKINLDSPIVHYLPELKNTNKANLSIREMMTHQAGLQAWIPFYLETLDKNGNWDKEFYQVKKSKEFSIQVADNLFMKNTYVDSIYQRIAYSEIKNYGEYLYSDLGYFYIKKIIEKVAQKPLNEYVEENFYQKMNLKHMTYLPLEKFKKSQIVPTEADLYFRGKLIQGHVHDPATAMLGGVGGHAGLFSNALDLGKLMYCYKEGGSYGETQFLKPETISEFTTQQFIGNRRGICFDKQEPDTSKASPTCESATLMAFGHSGFTGCYTWADPDYDLIYVFLSNRIHPDAANRKLIQMNIRTEILEILYQGLKE